jgi:hypothetical protein
VIYVTVAVVVAVCLDGDATSTEKSKVVDTEDEWKRSVAALAASKHCGRWTHLTLL